jgi:hypothetical protein
MHTLACFTLIRRRLALPKGQRRFCNVTLGEAERAGTQILLRNSDSQFKHTCARLPYDAALWYATAKVYT